MKLKDKIIALRKTGKTYDEIVEELHCAKSTVCYHLNPSQRNKTIIRAKKYQANQHPYKSKISKFVTATKNLNIKKCKADIKRRLNLKIQAFCKTLDNNFKQKRKYQPMSFTIQDVINKFGEHPKCYLTGETIDIYDPASYQFDHKVPVSRGGDCTIDNLGLCVTKANLSKRDMTVEEMVDFYKKVLENLGYQVQKKERDIP